MTGRFSIHNPHAIKCVLFWRKTFISPSLLDFLPLACNSREDLEGFFRFLTISGQKIAMTHVDDVKDMIRVHLANLNYIYSVFNGGNLRFQMFLEKCFFYLFFVWSNLLVLLCWFVLSLLKNIEHFQWFIDKSMSTQLKQQILYFL